MRSYEEISEPSAKVGVRVNLDSTYDTNREDFVNYARHKVHAKTIDDLYQIGSKVVILAHHTSSNPKVMKRSAELIQKYSNTDVSYVGDKNIGSLWENEDSNVVLYQNLENVDSLVRSFDTVNESRDHNFVNKMASKLDVYVNDCLSLCHRKYPTITGLPSEIPGYAGRSLESEYRVLSNLESKSDRKTYVFGGKRIDQKVSNIRKILENSDESRVLTTGYVGCVFLQADGYNLGEKTETYISDNSSDKSVDQAYELLTMYGDRIYIPKDLATGTSGNEYALSATPLTSRVTDIGSETVDMYLGIIDSSDIVVASGVSNRSSINGYKDIYSKVSDQEYSLIIGEETIEFCDNLNLTGFSHTSMHTDPVVDLFVGDNQLPGVDLLLPSDQ